MEQSFTIKTDELEPSLVAGMKKYLFAVNAKEITISFDTPKKTSLRYETQEEANLRIENSIENLESGKTIAFTGDEFIQMAKLLSKIK